MMLKITQQTQADSQVIEALMIEAFGPNRYNRSVWALRPGAPLAALCLVGYDDDQAIGSLRFWEVMLNDEAILTYTRVLQSFESLQWLRSGDHHPNLLQMEGHRQEHIPKYSLLFQQNDPGSWHAV